MAAVPAVGGCNDGRSTLERVLAWIVVLGLHLLLAGWLWQFTGLRLHAGQRETRLQVQWLPRPAKPWPAPAPAPLPAVAGGASPPRVPARAAGIPGAQLPAAAPAAPATDRPAAARLDLSLPASVAADAPRQERRPWERAAPLQFRGTRFNERWTPDRGEIQDGWAHRSKLAALLLSATGALQRPCSADERMRRLPKCFGIQYSADDDPPPATGD